MKYSTISVEQRERQVRNLVLLRQPGKEEYFKPEEGSDCSIAIPRSNGTVSRGKLKDATIMSDGEHLFGVNFEERGETMTKLVPEAVLKKVNPDVRLLFKTLETQRPSIVHGFAAVRALLAHLFRES